MNDVRAGSDIVTMPSVWKADLMGSASDGVKEKGCPQETLREACAEEQEGPITDVKVPARATLS